MRNKKHIRFAIAFLVPLAFVFSQCFHKNKSADPRGDKYAGSTTCLKCHKNVYQNFLHSTHFRSSRDASEATVSGSFQPGLNTVDLNDSIKVVMEKHPDGLYQAAYTKGKLTEKERIDIAIGSYRGETYLSWKGSQVRQLPITYYINMHQWANSPGYSADSANFERVIGRRCFECHSSYIQNIANQTGSAGNTEFLDKRTLILGIDCERCHGPGAEHVDFHTQNPGGKKPMYMVKISSLSRSQRIDLCSVCHSGNTSIMVKSTFDFKPGDTLANFTNGEPFHKAQDVKNIDVHGNQVKLLTSSNCFMGSKIECATCHTIHDNAPKSVALYSQACIGCHSVAKHNFCKMAGQLGQAIYSKCIDCHMPVKTSKAIVINGAKNITAPPFLARTHLIAIYPEESKKIMDWMKTGVRR